jgi:hypothetical protein
MLVYHLSFGVTPVTQIIGLEPNVSDIFCIYGCCAMIFFLLVVNCGKLGLWSFGFLINFSLLILLYLFVPYPQEPIAEDYIPWMSSIVWRYSVLRYVMASLGASSYSDRARNGICPSRDWGMIASSRGRL